MISFIINIWDHSLEKYITTKKKNHLITFYNVFEAEAATRILFFRVEKKFHPSLKTFLVFINKMPHNDEDISLDDGVIQVLRNIK